MELHQWQIRWARARTLHQGFWLKNGMVIDFRNIMEHPFFYSVPKSKALRFSFVSKALLMNQILSHSLYLVPRINLPLSVLHCAHITKLLSGTVQTWRCITAPPLIILLLLHTTFVSYTSAKFLVPSFCSLFHPFTPWPRDSFHIFLLSNSIVSIAGSLLFYLNSWHWTVEKPFFQSSKNATIFFFFLFSSLPL